MRVFSIALVLLASCTFSLAQNWDVHVGGPDFEGGVNGNPLVDFYLTSIEDCRGMYDVYVELYPTRGYDNNLKAPIDVSTIKINPVSNPSEVKTLDASTGFQTEFYDLQSTTRSTLDFAVRSFDASGRLLNTTTISKPAIRDGSVEVSESFFTEIFDMGHSSRTTGTGGGFDPNDPDFEEDVFTYFCGKRISKVVLLSFFQDFLSLSPADICEFKALFELRQLGYRSTETVEWTQEYCTLLEDYWDSYVNRGGGGGDSTDCQCKVINSRVFVDHSVGNATGSALENCPDVSVQSRYKLYAESSPYGTHTHSKDNWAIQASSHMGAAKAMYSVSSHYTGADDVQGTAPWKTHDLPNSELRSGVQFSMKCYNPYNAAIDTSCECEKDVLMSAQYASRVDGRAGTQGNGISAGNGQVRSCMEDFVFLTLFTREGGDMLQGNAASTCVSCRSEDNTSFLTDLGTLAAGITEVVPTVVDTGGFDISNIAAYFNAANTVVELFSDILINPPCDQLVDTPYVLIDTSHFYTLTPQKDYVAYVISSRISSRVQMGNDEAFHELRLVSDYYLAAGLESRGDSTCCNEKAGGYTIGHLGESIYPWTASVDGRDMTFDGHEMYINNPFQTTGILIERPDLFVEPNNPRSPNTLARLQRDVAQFFTLIDGDFLKDVFGLDCGPGCAADMDCYYNCGYYRDCTNDEDERVANTSSDHLRNGEDALTSGADAKTPENSPFRAYVPTADVLVFPNPSNTDEKVVVEVNSSDYESLHVLSSSGQLLFSKNLGEERQQVILKEDQMLRGINFLMLRRKDGSIYIDKLIRN